jgi:hypothetical protein
LRDLRPVLIDPRALPLGKLSRLAAIRRAES